MRSDREPLPVWRRWHLVGLAAALPLIEAVVLLALGLRSGMVLAPQASALGPFGVFHDLRWLFVFHGSVWAFVDGLIAGVLIAWLYNRFQRPKG